jgi:hypothetical protein|tara:strand:+ start:1855 stop:2079 length:225 start_codon:yes stop_codon:yes gene_type:complete
MFLKYFDFRYFFISFAIGILYVYLTDDYKKVIVIYPNPDNIEKYTYLDKANNCFQYELDETNCAEDSVEVGATY